MFFNALNRGIIVRGCTWHKEDDCSTIERDVLYLLDKVVMDCCGFDEGSEPKRVLLYVYLTCSYIIRERMYVATKGFVQTFS